MFCRFLPNISQQRTRTLCIYMHLRGVSLLPWARLAAGIWNVTNYKLQVTNRFLLPSCDFAKPRENERERYVLILN